MWEYQPQFHDQGTSEVDPFVKKNAMSLTKGNPSFINCQIILSLGQGPKVERHQGWIEGIVGW